MAAVIPTCIIKVYQLSHQQLPVDQSHVKSCYVTYLSTALTSQRETSSFSAFPITVVTPVSNAMENCAVSMSGIRELVKGSLIPSY